MTTFSNCLKKAGLNPEEIRIYDDLVAKHQTDGMSVEDAQKAAAQSRLDELGQDRVDVVSKIEAAIKVLPADVTGELTEESRTGQETEKPAEKITDVGDEKVLFSIAEPETTTKKSLPTKKLNAIISRITGTQDPAGLDGIVVAPDFESLPNAIKVEAEKQGTDGKNVRGIYHGGKIYLVESNITSEAEVELILFHEGTHKGAAELFANTGVKKAMNNLWVSVGGQKGFNKIVKDSGINLDTYITGVTAKNDDGTYRFTKAQREQILMNELLAHIGQTGSKSLKQRALDLVGAIRAWLRDNGYMKLAELGVTDLSHLAKTARERGLGKKLKKKSDVDLVLADDALFMVAYHGTPHKVDKFSMENIGTGEGVQAFGYGLYFAENPNVAGSYQKNLPYRQAKKEFLSNLPEDADFDEVMELIGTDVFSKNQEDVINALDANDWLGFDYPSQAISAAYMEIDNFDPTPELKSAIDNSGSIYEVEIPEEYTKNFLNWDTPLSKQSAGVKSAISKLVKSSPDSKITQFMVDDNVVGGALYGGIVSQFAETNDSQKASELLDSVGIKGIKYYDAVSRPSDIGDQRIRDIMDKHNSNVDAALDEYMRSVHETPKQKEKIRAAIRGQMEKEITRNLVVFDDSIVEITAIDGKPVDAPLFSLTPDRKYTKEQQAAIDKGGFGAIKEAYQSPLKAALGKAKDRLDESKQVWKTILRQGFLDQYDSFRTIINDKRAWMMANLSEASGGTVEAALEYGRPFMNRGAVDVDVNKKSLSQIFEPLGAEVNDWLMWVAGNRAERLASEERERLFSDVDIQALKSLNNGKMDDGRSRSQVYEAVRKEFEEMNDAFVKIGTKTGVISPDEANVWRKQGFYVPFYRIAEEESKKGVTGPYTGGGLVRQTAYKRLKGADIPLGDLLTNVIMNWNHIVSSGLKNQAAVEALSSAENMGLATQVSEKDKSKDAVFIRLRGKKMWLELDDTKEGQLVLESLMSLNYEGMNSFMMKAARKFKRALTYGVTANPEFKAANLFRDTIQAVAVAGMSTNIAKNLKQGFKSTKKGSPTIARMIAGGGAFGDSGYIHGSDPEALQRLIKKDIDRMTILDSPKRIQKMWDAYQDFGARLENVNRAANFEQDLSRGDVDLLTANFNARDHLDFQRTGAFTSIRILAQVVPFLNARLQGLSKLGRAGFDKNQRKQFMAVLSTYAMASVLLYLYMKDDDDYDEAPQWERDAYHLFKIPGSDVMYRLPRPFEVGFIATIAERAVEQMVNDKVHGELFFERVWHGLTETLSFNPVPQMIMPAVEVWANHNMFTNRQIESEPMKKLSPSERKRAWTSETAIAMSKGFNTILWDDVVLSPLQIEHLVNGYFGWIGGTALESSDMIIRGVGLAPSIPERRIQDYMLVGRFARTGPTRGTRYLTEFYENLHDANRAYANIRFAAQLGDQEKAMKLAEKNEDKLAIRGIYAGAQKSISRINKAILITRSKDIPSDEKLEEIESLNMMKNQIAKRVIEKTQGK